MYEVYNVGEGYHRSTALVHVFRPSTIEDPSGEDSDDVDGSESDQHVVRPEAAGRRQPSEKNLKRTLTSKTQEPKTKHTRSDHGVIDLTTLA